VTPTEILEHEHEIILLALDGAEREAQQIQNTGTVRAERVNQMLDFFRNFADRCHHAKEEDLLFVKMQERGVPTQGGPIGAMLQEHDQGRRMVTKAAEALPSAKEGDSQAVTAVKRNLLAFARMLRAHIDKENSILYPIADRVFTAEDQQELMEAFDRVEAEEMGEGTHERYHQLAHEWAG
jgi:hemerythrin-like domain-containing protein